MGATHRPADEVREAAHRCGQEQVAPQLRQRPAPEVRAVRENSRPHGPLQGHTKSWQRTIAACAAMQACSMVGGTEMSPALHTQVYVKLLFGVT